MTLSKNKSIIRFSNILERFALPVALNIIVMTVIFSTYKSNNIGLIALLYFGYQSVLFLLFEWLKPKKIIRGIVYIVVLAVMTGIGMILLSAGYEKSSRSFIDWFYLDTKIIGDIDQYFLFLFFCLGFFMTSIIYYFTIIRYRTFGTMLVLLFPFLIYGKRSDNLSSFSTTLMLTVFLAMIVHNKQVSDDTVKNTKFNLSYVIGIAIFVTFSGAAATLIPNPGFQSQLEKNKEFFNFYSGKNVTDYDTFSNTSSPRYGSESTGEILFYVKTDENTSKLFLRRQSYDEFSQNRWIVSENERFSYFGSEEMFPPNTENEFNSPIYVYNMMRNLASSGIYKKQYGLSDELFKDEAYNSLNNLSFYSEDFYPRYIPAPIMIFDKNNTGNIVKDNFGNIRRTLSEPTLLGGDFTYISEGNPEHKYALSLTFDSSDYLNLLENAVQNGDISQSEYDTTKNIYSAYTYVDENEVDTQRIKELSDSIIKNCKNDYQKAKALENYFEQNNFIYDLDYVPDDDSIEYFLFNSKMGSCSSYATAMTLMARLSGLPARYVEGFAAYERAKEYPDSFVVKDSDAHAFVEVYIAGAGWTTFDPTVAGYETESETQDNGGIFNTKVITTFVSYFSRIILFLAVAFVVIFIIFIERIIEIIFRIRLKFSNNTDKILRLYRRIVDLLEHSSKERFKGYTANEILMYCIEERNANISAITELFEKTCFGGYVPTNEEISHAYKVYRQNWKLFAKEAKSLTDKKKPIGAK